MSPRFSDRKPYALLWGGYGGGNVGDYLTLAVAIHEVEQQTSLGIQILNPSGTETNSQFPNYPVTTIVKPTDSPLVYKYQKAIIKACTAFRNVLPHPVIRALFSAMPGIPWIGAMAKAQRLVLVGGGYINDLFGKETLYVVQAANLLGIPVETAPVGIGPFNNPAVKAEFGETFRQAHICARDPESVSLVNSLGLRAELRADDGFKVADLKPEWQASAKQARPTGNKVGICVFEQFGANDAQREWWLAFLRELKHQAPEIELEGFSFDSRPKFEYETLTRLLPESGWRKARILKPFSDFRDAINHLRKEYAAVITCRFHAAVVSQAFGIPAIAFASGQYYVAKMESVQNNSQHCQVVSPETHTPVEAVQILLNAYRKQTALQTV